MRIGTILLAAALAWAPAVTSAKTCRTGCACGDTCIDCSYECHKDDAFGDFDGETLLLVLGTVTILGMVYYVVSNASGSSADVAPTMPTAPMLDGYATEDGGGLLLRGSW